MSSSKRWRDPLPRLLVQGVVVALLLSTTHSQWLSFKNSRNPKSNLWFPNMPSQKTLQQRSSIGSSIRGLGPSSSSSSNNVNNGGSSSSNSAGSSSNNNNNVHQSNRQRSTRPIGHRSVSPHLHLGQPTYQTVHGGVINRHESVNGPNRSGYSSSSRLQNQQQPGSQNQRQQQQGRAGQSQPSQSWNGKQAQIPQPTVVTSKHLSIILNQPARSNNNKQPNTWPSVGSSLSTSGTAPVNQGYTSSRRLLEVGRVGHVEVSSAPTHRPITQVEGALQDSWPNSNTHHHLSPIMKNQKPNDANSRSSYYDQNGGREGGPNGWGTSVTVSNQAIEIKMKPKPGSMERNDNFNNNSVERKLSVGREKLVSNTLNTLAKLSPKKPIFVYMRVEGIAAIEAGAEAGDVIKKLAGGSKLPFYNGTRSLPKENVPQVFLAPEDMPPPANYGKVPIPNLRTKETTTTKPTFTKILLPGGTKMTSGLASTPPTSTTTTTTPTSPPLAQILSQFVQSTAQSAVQPSEQPLSLEQRIQILQMFQNQQVAMQQRHHQPTYQPQVQPTYQPLLHPQQNYQSRPQLPYQPQLQPTYPPQSQPHPTLRPYQQSQPSYQPPLSQPTFQPYPQPQPSYQPPQPPPTYQPHPQPHPAHQPHHQPHPTYQPHPQPTQQPLYHQPQQPQTQPTAPAPTPHHTDFLRDVLPQGAILESITPMGGELHGGDLNHYSQHPVQTPSNSIDVDLNKFPNDGSTTVGNPNLQNMLGSMIESAVSKTVTDMVPNFQQQVQQHDHQPGRLGHAQSREQIQQHYKYQQIAPSPSPFVSQQHFVSNPGPVQVPMFNNGQQMAWNQPKMDNNVPRPRFPNGPPPNRNTPLKNALSFLGIQTTPRPNAGPTQRPFPFQPNPSSPAPQNFNNMNGSPTPTRAPFHHYSPTPRPMASRRDDVGSSGSGNIEHSHLPGMNMANNKRPPGQTLIVQTPDASKPNGQKSTFVISNGDGNPDLNKIMKVLTELNGEQPAGGNQHPLHFSPTRPPQPFYPSPTPITTSPTGRPTIFPFNPTARPQQPQVMIRHPSGTPTPGPILMNPGRPDGLPLHQIVSSTFSPNGGPTTLRPSFVSSTAGPMFMGPSPSPSSSSMQIVKALSHPDFVQFPQPTARPQPTQAAPRQQLQQQPPQQRQPQITFNTINGGSSGQPNAMIMKSIMDAIPGVMTNNNIRPSQQQQATAAPHPSPAVPTAILPPGMTGIPPGSVPKVIEVDPNLSPEEMQKAIMDSIMKHQQETNGGVSTGPIVINAHPSMGSVLGNSPHFMTVQPSGASPTKSGFTVQPAIDDTTPPRRSKPSSIEVGSGSVEKQPDVLKNQVITSTSGSKEHHHSKEVSSEKSLKKPKSEESLDKYERQDQRSSSSEEKVIEKVITEEKIVWNPGSREGEMIPSRIRTEERIIVTPHGSSKSNEKQTETDVVSFSREKSRPSSTEHKNSFGASLIKTRGKIPETDEESSPDKSEDNKSTSLDSSNFAGLLRSKLKFEKMKEKLYPKTVADSGESENPFSRYLHPSSVATDASSTSTVPVSETTQQFSSLSTSMSPEPTVTQQSLLVDSVDNGRFKIRPGDISSNTKVADSLSQGPAYGISPSGQAILLQPTAPALMASPSPTTLPSPSPSAFSPSAFPSPSPSVFPPTGPSSFPSIGPSISPPTRPSMFSPSPSPLSSFLSNSSGNRPASYIGPSPSSYPFLQASPSAPTYPNPPTPSPIIPPGTKEEKLIFIPVDSSPAAQPSTNPGPSSMQFQTRNGQNQTVVFTTMSNLPDLMSQLSGTKTEVRMIDDLKSFQATLAKVHATQASSTIPPPTQPAPTADRRVDTDEKPITWRPNGTVPVPTLESLRQRFPSGLGANVLHAVAAGLAANDPSKPKWGQNGQQQFIYTMPNGVPISLNPMGGYQQILVQGTKDPMLAYYGYNWNNANNGVAPIEVSTFKPIETAPEDEPKYTSRFRGSAPVSPDILQEPEPISKAQTKDSSTRNPIDPVSEEYEELSKESSKTSKSPGKSNDKTKSDEYDERPKSSRRRPGALKDDTREDPSQEVALKKKSPITPNVLSKRIDGSVEQDSQVISEKKKVQVHKEIFVHSGEKNDDDATPTSKLPILLAPSIISRKSVVSKTGSSYSDDKKAIPIPTAAASVAETTHTTSKQLTSAVTKILSTISPTKSTSKQDKSDDEDLRETQAELKSLLKKLQQKLNSRDEVYELGDGFYDYYEELHPVPSTKASTTTTTTTTTKGTKKPVKSPKKSKSKKKTTKKSKSKNKKKNNKKTKDKPKTKKTTTTSTTTTPRSTTTKPVIVTSSALITTTTTTKAPSSPSIMNHNRHPVSSIETFTAPSSVPTSAAHAQLYQASSEIPQKKTSEPTVEPTLPSEPPSTSSTSTKAPTSPPSATTNDASSVAFVYPQAANKDVAASNIHHRRRPLWVRRKHIGGGASGSGSVEGSLEPLAQPTAPGKVIRLVRRKRPGLRRRPVFVQQSIEVDQNFDQVQSSTTPIPTISTTTTMPVDILFENTNDLSKRIGYPDSLEKSEQQLATPRVQGKRKLKLVRLKGQRAQWKLKMNEEQDPKTSFAPQAEKLVSPPVDQQQLQHQLQLQLPIASPPSVAIADSQSQIIQAERQSRQESPNSIEAKVCIRGKCEMISK